MQYKNYLLLITFMVIDLQGFTQQELVDSSFNYFTEHSKTIDEAHVDTILQEIDLISKQDGLDKNLVLQQLSDRIQEQIHYHGKYIRGKWHHPAAKPALILALAGVGFLGITYAIYKKWSAPINGEFEVGVNNLKQYGVTIEEQHTVEHYVKLTVYKNTIVYTPTRSLSATEKAFVKKAVDNLVELRKSQNWIWEYLEIPGLIGALFSFMVSSFFYDDIRTCNYEEHAVRYEKYQMILQKIIGAQL